MTKTKSGNATISANVRYKMNETASEENQIVSIIQRIDHDTPYKISLYHIKASEGTVGTEDPIIVWVQDPIIIRLIISVRYRRGDHGESVVFSITGQPEPPQPVSSLLFPDILFPKIIHLLPVM